MSKKRLTADDVRLRKVRPNDEDGCGASYEVARKDNFKLLGYVFSREGFSYRGSQGWNSGIRLADFHPKEWHFSRTSETMSEAGWGRHSRKSAVAALLDKVQAE